MADATAEATKKCPKCGEVNAAVAVVCKKCTEKFPDVVPPVNDPKKAKFKPSWIP